MPQQWEDAIVMVLHKKMDRTECGNYRSISLVAYAGKILLKIIARRLSENCKRVGILPGEQSGFRPNRSTTDMMFVIRRVTGAGAEETNSAVCMLYRPYKAYDSVDRTLLWTVLARFGVPQNTISVIRQFHIACEHACGSTTGCARGDSLWNKAFVKGAYSSPSCSTSSLRQL